MQPDHSLEEQRSARPGRSGASSQPGTCPAISRTCLALGVFATVAIGAALQMLPVATRQPMPTSWPIRLGFWLYVPAVPVLVPWVAPSRLEEILSVGPEWLYVALRSGITLRGHSLCRGLIGNPPPVARI